MRARETLIQSMKESLGLGDDATISVSYEHECICNLLDQLDDRIKKLEALTDG